MINEENGCTLGGEEKKRQRWEDSVERDQTEVFKIFNGYENVDRNVLSD